MKIAKPSLKLACQTITFGDEQRHFLPRVFEAVAAAGYTGVEIGFRHLEPTAPASLQGELDRQGLTLVATHIGGNLEDAGQASGERAIIDVVLSYLEALDTDLLMYSGLKFENEDQFQGDLSMLREAEHKCRRKGIRLLYHNHDWEFHQSGRVIEALIEETDIGFCPDIGWVMKGGWDAIALLNRMGDRVGAVHLKDFASETGDKVDTVMLGKGVAPLSSAVQWVAEARPELWLVAEQDEAHGSPEEAIAQNAAFLRSATTQTQATRH